MSRIVLVPSFVPFCHLPRQDRAALAHQQPSRFRYIRATPVRDTLAWEKAFTQIELVLPEAPSE